MDQPIIIQIQFNLHTVYLCLAILFLFGIIYNGAVAWIKHQRQERGFLSFIVAFGCGLTILIGLYLPTKNLVVTGLMVAAFFASGLPMMFGSVVRFCQDRAREEQASKTDVQHEL